MAQPSARPEYSNLTLRILSAAVLLPLAVAAVWFGGVYFLAFVVLIGACMGREFSNLCNAGTAVTVIMATMLGILPIVLYLAGSVAALGWIIFLLAVTWFGARYGERAGAGLLVVGAGYLAAGTLAITWLRLVPEDGALIVLWVVAVVVGTDVGAYFAGRGIGGPKLAPAISPSKTWAGLIGGMVSAAVAGWCVARFGTGSASLSVALASGCFAVIAQVGDLIESALKRHFGVKDSGSLIPGHGGVLDRLDGYLAVAPVVVLVTMTAGGSPLVW